MNRTCVALLSALLGAAGAGASPSAAAEAGPQDAAAAEAARERARAALGRRLFFDPRLSRTGLLACASCHRPERAFADGRRRPFNDFGKELGRNAPTVANAPRAGALFWDGRAAGLEEQAILPLLHPEEGALSERELVARLAAVPSYRRDFARAFGGVSTAAVAAAIAAFERTLSAADSPLDRFLRGDRRALSASARRGLALFRGKARCAQCHGGADFSDGSYRRTGVPAAGPWRFDPGRMDATGDPADFARFRVPSLRNAALTAPYMHNGAFPSLRRVLEFYDRGGGAGADAELRPLRLAEEEKAALIAFLRSLTGCSLARETGDPDAARAACPPPSPAPSPAAARGSGAPR